MTDTTAGIPTRPLARDEGALAFLLARRSRSAKTLTRDAPEPETIRTVLAAASRTPDHGKLAPWRFVVAHGPEAMDRLERAARERAAALGLDAGAVDKAAAAFTWGGAVIAVVSRPVPGHKIPVWEQELSAGAVCLAALNAALASGWGANWLSGPLARDRGFLSDALGCADGETVAGFIHMGRETVVPADRDRPDPEAITTWL